MNVIESDILKSLMNKPFVNQRVLSEATGYSLGKVNETLKELNAEGYLNNLNQLTDKAESLIAKTSPKNAIILAAGSGMRMVPVNMSFPKALLEVNGERLIERLIRQLNEAGINDITVVVGFMKESFEYLIDKYGVKLTVNRDYFRKNNLHTLNLVRNNINNTYIVPCDIWCAKNPFSRVELHSWYMLSNQTSPESNVRVNRKNEIVIDHKSGKGNGMVGIAYLIEPESEVVKENLNVNGTYGYAAYGEWGEIDRPQFVDLYGDVVDEPIYMSRLYNQEIFKGAYGLGDEITLKINGRERTFTVAGFYESISLYEIFYVDPVTLSEINSENARPIDQIVFQLADGVDIDEEYNKICNEFDSRGIVSGVNSINELKLMYTQMINIISVFFCAFAIIITMVVLIVIYFRITNSIEQNITNIGALKALGYTAHQIRTAHILEFVITAGIGCVISTGLIYLIISPLEVALRSIAYMSWEHPFDPVSLIITLIVIIGSSFLVALKSTSSIKSLDPVIALRFGLKSHTFKRNVVSLETSSGPLVWLMALKSSFAAKKQNILVTVVMSAIGISLAMAVFVGYNIGVEPVNLQKLLTDNYSDIWVSVNDDNPIYEISDLPYVTDVWWKDSFSAAYMRRLKVFPRILMTGTPIR